VLLIFNPIVNKKYIMSDIFISASELAIITGHNSYKTPEEIILKYWKRHFKQNYNDFLEKMSTENKSIKKEETEFETINRIAKENNININVKKCLNNRNTESLNKNKDELFKETLNKVSSEDATKLKDAINKVTNTHFGIKNENNGIDLYSQKTNSKVEITHKYFKKELSVIENNFGTVDSWYLGGKVDGLTNIDGEKIIVEIKNRVNKLFNCVRDYEKVQCFAYMYILDINNVHLVETLKSSKNQNMNIMNISYNEEFMDDIIEKIEQFIYNFYDFLEDDTQKEQLLVNSK
jgi:hypothetical protein